MKREKQRPSERREDERHESDTERAEQVERKGDEIEDELDRLDEMIDDALGEDEEEAERRAQEFVDGFKQEGGE